MSWILVLFAALGGARLLPRWLARLGMAASVVHLMGIPLPEFMGFRLDTAALWGMPLALVYAGAACLLIVRGSPVDADVPDHDAQVIVC